MAAMEVPTTDDPVDSLPVEDSLPLFAPWDPRLKRDPALFFRRLRTDPVHRVDFLMGWILSSYAHVT